MMPTERQSRRVAKWLNSDRFLYRNQGESWVAVSLMTPRGRFYPRGGDAWLEEYCQMLADKPKTRVALAEIQDPNVYLLVDVDFKVKLNDLTSPPPTLYTELELMEVVEAYTKVLKEWLPDADPSALVLTKPPYIKEGYGKHGFHIHFQRIYSPVANVKAIHANVKSALPPRLAEAVDDVTTKPWLMYGSRKTKTSGVYKAVWATDSDGKRCTVQEWLDKDERYFGEERTRIPADPHYLPLILSTRWCRNMNYHHPNLRASKTVLAPVKKRKPALNPEDVDDETKEKLIKLIPRLDPSRADEYRMWITVMSVIHNILGDEGIDLAHQFSASFPDKYDEMAVDQRYRALGYTSHGLDVVQKMVAADERKKQAEEKPKKALKKAGRSLKRASRAPKRASRAITFSSR
jgi:hypothetical protein